MEQAEREETLSRAGTGTYVAVWVSLMALLAVTILVAKIEFSAYHALVNIIIASLKAVIVLLFFMHLRYEGRFIKATLSLTILVLTVVIALTFSDVWYR